MMKVLGLGLMLLWTSLTFAKFQDGHPYVKGQVIVKYRSTAVQAQLSLPGEGRIGTLMTNFGDRQSGLYSVGNVDVKSLIQKLEKDPSVAYAEPNYILSVEPLRAARPGKAARSVRTTDEGNLPNDPMFKDLWGMNNEGQTGGTKGWDVKAVKAWETSKGSKNVVVAVIDTGVDYTHEDLSANIHSNAGEMGKDAEGKDKATNGKDDDANGFVDDWHGWDFANKDNDPKDDHSHGTHCAGTIGGTGNNGKGVVGVNWTVSILPIKFLTGSGSGTLADAVLSIDYATKMKVDIMSNSWGGGGFTKTMEDSIIRANDAGILFVAAAGNSTSNNDKNPHYPSSYGVANVLAVAAIDHNGAMASFSSYGATTVDLAAPGVDILSSVVGNTYKKYSGTSMATPHVAGAAALVRAVFPSISHLDLKARLMATVTPNVNVAGKTVAGGVVDVFSAMENDSVPPSTITDLKISGNDLTSVEVEFGAVGDDANAGAAAGYVVKYADQPIADAKAFDAAKLGAVVSSSAPAGQKVKVLVPGLNIATAYFFAVRARDNVNNVSAVSNSVKGQTANVAKLYEADLENCGDCTSFHAVGGWKLTDKAAHSGKRSFGLNLVGQEVNGEAVFSVLDTDAISLNGKKQAMLSFWHKFNMPQYGADGRVFVSGDNGDTWAEIAVARGTSEWKNEFVDLSTVLKDAKSVMLKFAHINTGATKSLTWNVDDVVVFVKEDPKPPTM